MTSQKLSSLPLLTGAELAANDLFYLADVSAGDNGSRGINYSQLASSLAAGATGVATGSFNSRAEAIASTIGAGVQYVRTAGYTTPGDYGGALHVKVVSEPAHDGKFQSADGAWWELRELEVTLEMFGGKGDGVYGFKTTPHTGTDNWPAFQKAYTYGKAFVAGVYGSRTSILLGRGAYYFSQTIQIDNNIRITGTGASASGNAETQSKLLFDENVTAFIFWAHHTADPALGGAVHGKSAYGSILENIRVMGKGGIGTYPQSIDGIYTDNGDLTKHAVTIYATVHIKDCTFQDFAGNGLHMESLVGGSVFMALFENVRLVQCGGHGVFNDGGDTSVNVGIGVDCTYSGGWGIWDSSFLGNSWIGCHTSAGANRVRVSHLSKRYHCIHPTLCSTTVPGTDNTVWEFYKNGGRDIFFPQWVSGNKYLRGGPYCTLSDAIGGSPGFSQVFIGCYAEGGQAPNRFNDTTLYLGGTNANPFVESASLVMSGGGVQHRFGARNNLKSTGRPGVSVMMGLNDSQPITLYAENDDTSGYSFPRWNTTWNSYEFRHGTLNTSMILTSGIGLLPTNCGRGSPLGPGNVILPNRVFTGRTLADSRMITFDNAAPTTGPEYAKGDIVFNQAPDVGEVVGWICTQGGLVATTALWVTGTNYPLAASGSFIRTSTGKNYRLYFDGGTSSSVVEPTEVLHSPLADGYGWIFVEDIAPSHPAWSSGTNYARHAYVLNAGLIYRCTVDPGGTIPSTSPPTHSAGEFVYGDGYGWTIYHQWTTGTNYAVGAMVKIPSALTNIYKCTISPGAGLSTVSPQDTDVYTYPDNTKWRFTCTPSDVPIWAAGVYALGALVLSTSAVIYRCIKVGTGSCTVEPRHEVARGIHISYADGYQWKAVIDTAGSLNWQMGKVYVVTWDESKVFNSAGDAYDEFAQNAIVRVSTVEPSHTNAAGQMETDFHGWRYIGNTAPIWKTWGIVNP